MDNSLDEVVLNLKNDSIKKIPAADTIINDSLHHYTDNIVNGPKTSIGLPDNQDIDFKPISERILKNCRRKLESIKNPLKITKWPDVFCSLASTGLGTDLGAALSGVSPFSTYTFLVYMLATLLAVGCGVAYFMFPIQTSSLDYESIANELLQDLPDTASLTNNRNNKDGKK